MNFHHNYDIMFVNCNNFTDAHIQIVGLYVVVSEKRGNFAPNAIFGHFSNQGFESPRLLTWFVDSLGLLLYKFNVRSYSKPPVLNGEPPN